MEDMIRFEPEDLGPGSYERNGDKSELEKPDSGPELGARESIPIAVKRRNVSSLEADTEPRARAPNAQKAQSQHQSRLATT